jgi:rubrerythrin
MSYEKCLNCGKPFGQCTCGKVKPITVEVDLRGQDSVQNEMEELRTRAEHAENLLELASEAEFKKALSVNKIENPEIDTPEKLDAYLKGRKEQEEKNKPKGDGSTTSGKGASGKAPLSLEPSQSANVKEYPDFESMTKDLNEREKSPNPEVRKEAEQIKKKMFEKMLKNPHDVTTEFDFGINKIYEDIDNKNLESPKPEVKQGALERLKASKEFQKRIKVKDGE